MGGTMVFSNRKLPNSRNSNNIKLKAMYNRKLTNRTLLKREPLVQGETIENKVSRMIKNKEPIKDGAPLIFTERKDGVIAGYNIRTDRWEVAADAMDKIAASKAAKSAELIKGDEVKTIKLKPDGGAESTDGKAESK